MNARIQALACLIAVVPAAHGGETGPRRYGDSPRDIRAVAMQQIDAGLKKLDELVGRKTETKARHEELWTQQCDEYFDLWDMRMGKIEAKLTEQKLDTSEHKAWRAPYDRYIAAVRADGYAAIRWRGVLRDEKNELKDDVDDYKDTMERLVEEMDEVEGVVEAAAATVGDKDVAVATLDKHVEALDTMVRVAGSLGDSLQGTVDTIEKRRGLKAPEMPKNIKAILTRWDAPQEAYQGVPQRWTEYLTAWAKSHRKDWDAFKKARKTFDETYGPVIAGKVFDGRKRFKGVKYTDFERPVEDMRTSVRAWRLKAKKRDTDLSELRKALEEEKRISADEKKQYDALNEPYSPTKLRELEIAHAQAAGGAEKVRELEVQSAKAKAGSAEEKALLEQIEILRNDRHPEQVAARKALNEYKKGEAEAIRKSRELMARRKRRRAKLGLSEDFD